MSYLSENCSAGRAEFDVENIGAVHQSNFTETILETPASCIVTP